MEALEIIQLLNLQPLPLEGGYYKETYISDESVAKACLPERYANEKPFYTSIYYLITPTTFSSLHRLPTDEIFHFYLGDPVEMLQLHPNGKAECMYIGIDLAQGQRPQVRVPKFTWQGTKLIEGGKFALMGTTMGPGFGFEDFESPDIGLLQKTYPSFAKKITAFAPD